MQIETQIDGEVRVFTLVGSLDATSAPEAERSFGCVVDEKAPRVLLDLSGVEYISSGGIRAIIMLSRVLERNGGALKLCCLNPFVREVFEMTHLDRLYAIHGSRADALNAFGF